MLLCVAVIFSLTGITTTHQLPQCSKEGFSNGISKFPDPNNNKKYFICENSILISKQCANGYIFHLKKLDCVAYNDKLLTSLTSGTQFAETSLPSSIYFTATTEKPFKCPDIEEKNYPDEKNCKQYYHCLNKLPKLVSCPNLFLFDINTKQCQLFWIAKCYQSLVTTTVTTTIITTTTPKPPTCPAQSVEDFPYPSDCSYYYHCDNGDLVLKKCSFLHLFDVDKKQCRIFFLAYCGNSVELKSDIIDHNYDIKYNPSYKKELINNQRIKRSVKEVSSLTPEHLDNIEQYDSYQCIPGNVYDDVYPEDCHKYYHCDNGSLTIKKCSLLKDFDPLQLKCRWFFLVDCSLRTKSTTEASSSILTTIPITPSPHTYPSSSASSVLTTKTSTSKTTKHPHKTTHHHHPRKTTHHPHPHKNYTLSLASRL